MTVNKSKLGFLFRKIWTTEWDAKKLMRLTAALQLCLILSVFPSFSANRNIPVVPFFDFLSLVPTWVHDSLLIVNVLFHLVLLLFPVWQVAFLVNGLYIINGSLDLARFTPFFSLWFVWLGILGVSLYKKGHEEEHLMTLRWVFLATYFWAGLFKVNEDYPNVFSWLVSPFFDLGVSTWSYFLAHSSSIFEIICAVLLFSRRFRDLGVLFTLGLHFLILLFLGPWSHNHQFTFSWAIFQSTAAVVLFFRYKGSMGSLFSCRLIFSQIVRLVVVVLPVLNFVDLWSNYLSFHMYSANVDQGRLKVDDKFLAVNDKVRLLSEREGDTITWMLVSEAEMGVFGYPSLSYLRKMFPGYCSSFGSAASGLILETTELKKFLFQRRKRVTYLRCVDFLSKEALETEQ